MRRQGAARALDSIGGPAARGRRQVRHL